MSNPGLKNSPEFKHAHQVLTAHSIEVEIETRFVSLPPHKTIQDAFEQLNDLTGYTPEIKESLSAVARVVEQLTDQKATVRIVGTQRIGQQGLIRKQ